NTKMELLEDITDIRKLDKLDYLWIDGASRLSDISPVFENRTITNLRLENIPNLKKVDISQMKNLIALKINACNLSDTSFLLDHQKRLTVLLLENNPIKHVDGLAEALIPAAEMKTQMPPPDAPPEYPLTIDVKSIETITEADYSYLKEIGYYDMKKLDEGIKEGKIKVVK
ncbi:MAG: hypothetical protein V1709_12030, partial [Planctomycetota bacterium]